MRAPSVVMTPTEALSVPGNLPPQWEDPGLQKVWLAAQRREWQSLAIMAVSESVQTLPIAQTLAQIAWCYRGQPACAFDLRDVSLRLADYQIREVHELVASGTRVLVALRSAAENPTAVLVAREADAVVLCIALGESELVAAASAIADIGRERILGTIVIHGAARKKSRPTRTVVHV
jgi:hypothetical protein